MNPEREPVRVRAIVTAVLQLIAVLGIGISAELSEAIIVLAVALVPLLTWLQAEWARRRVTPSGPRTQPRDEI